MNYARMYKDIGVAVEELINKGYRYVDSDGLHTLMKSGRDRVGCASFYIIRFYPDCIETSDFFSTPIKYTEHKWINRLLLRVDEWHRENNYSKPI